MSGKRSFLPQHPKIVKRVGEKPDNTLRNSSYLNKSKEADEQVIDYIITKQKQEVENLKAKVEELTNKNNLMESSLAFYNNQDQKTQLTKLIQKAKIEQEEIMVKISNCEKVGESTTSEEYYLWQKKKRMDEYNRKIAEIQSGNKQEREELRQVCEKYKEKISYTKQEIQSILHEIEATESQYRDEESPSDMDEIDPYKIQSAKEQHEALLSTIGILRENNQILSTQLEESIQSIQLSLRKSFQNSRSSLIRELQLIKKQIENSQPSSPQDKSKLVSPGEAIDEYINRLNQIQQLLSKQEAEEASKIIRPFDWSSVKWEQYLGSQPESEGINYLQKFQKMSRDHEDYQRQVEGLQKQFQQVMTETIRLNQQNFSVESALIKLTKILQSLNRK